MPTPARCATAESVTSCFEEVNSFNAVVSRRSRFLCASARGERAISDSDKVASCKTEGPPYITLEAENPPFLQYSVPEDKIPLPQPISHKVWFITGASKGFGYVWTEAALARGDRVAAAARNIGSLDWLEARICDKLLALSLDVGDKKAVDAAVEKAHNSSAALTSSSTMRATACSGPSKKSVRRKPARR